MMLGKVTQLSHWHRTLHFLFLSLEIVSSAPAGVPTWWIIEEWHWRLRWSWWWQSWPRSQPFLTSHSCLLTLEYWVEAFVKKAGKAGYWILQIVYFCIKVNMFRICFKNMFLDVWVLGPGWCFFSVANLVCWVKSVKCDGDNADHTLLNCQEISQDGNKYIFKTQYTNSFQFIRVDRC